VQTIKRVFWGGIKLGLLLALVAVVALGVMVWRARAEMPDFESLKSSPNGQMIRVRSRDGQIIQTLGPSFGRWIPHDDIPVVMRDAMLSVEDRRYYSHIGVDPLGIARSVQVRVQRGHWAQGGSTITQQLARNIFLNNSRTFSRKLREAVLALALETKYSKEEILELYLNKVYFGGGAYGIDSASRKFFDHSATSLTLAEAAIIAGLVKAPSRYAPTADAEAAIGRAGVVIETMQRAGKITANEAASASPAGVKLAPEPPKASANYFLDWAMPQLDALIDETEEPIDVWTTVDLGMQSAAQNAVRAHAPAGAQGAMVTIERNGAVRALVGGLDYRTSNYNRAITAVRQPGSAWKLFVYLAALEAGFNPEDRVVDEPISIGGWAPKNSGGSYAGEMSVRQAFASSKNTVAAQIGNEIGFGTVASMARRLGITTPISTSPSMVLGSSETRLIEMTRAFAIVGNNGRDVKPYGIVKVATVDGKVLYHKKESAGEPLLDDNVTSGMLDLLVTAVNSGTGGAAQIGRPVAGKTGTTNSNKDGLFFGLSSGLTTGVWYGRDDAKPIKELQGGRAPARAFAQFMGYAVASRPEEGFDTDMTPLEWGEEVDGIGEGETADPDAAIFDEFGNMIDPAADGSPLGDDAGGMTREQLLDRALGKTPSDMDRALEGDLSPPSDPIPAPRPRDAIAPPKEE
jgi:penicillin-binding protein 1A